MDNTERDGLVLRLQGEISKLKEVFQYSTDSQNWAKSEKVCRCTDEEFNDLMQTLTANELEAATLILQRHIDLEQQITKCLENLKGVQSGDDKKSIDVTQKLITSQRKVARLRSRLLRCVTQQLQKKGSLACQLPPWSGPQMDDSGRLDHEEDERKVVEMNDSGRLDHEEKERKAVEMNDSGRLDHEENERKAVEMNDSGRLDHEENKRKPVEMNDSGRLDHEQNERKAVEMNDSGRLEEKEMKAVLPLEQDDQVDGEQDACSVDSGLNGEKTEEDNSPVYETIYPTASGVKGQMSTGGDSQANASLPVQDAEGEQAGADTGCESRNVEDNLTKDVSVQEPSTKVDTNACQSPPPKPVPYASPRKTNTAVGDNGGEKEVKKDKISADVPPVDEEDPDERIVEQHYLQNWDPTPVLKELFGNVRPLPSPSQQSTDSNVSTIRMAGYMEKLPVKNYQKKASVFKSWKKRHFKAMSGKLFYYEDHRALQPLGFIDLVGCSVKCVDDKMLEVVEQSGRSLKLKCAFVKEAEDWKESLEAEAVTPAPVPSVDESSATEDLTIIIDLGSSVVKAGFAQEDAWPQVMFPCVIAVDKQNTENCKFGFDALLPETRRTSTLTFPLRKSLKIDKLKFDTLDLIGILEHVFNQLKVDPSKHKDENNYQCFSNHTKCISIFLFSRFPASLFVRTDKDDSLAPDLKSTPNDKERQLSKIHDTRHTGFLWTLKMVIHVCHTCKVIMTLPFGAGDQEKEELVELLLDQFGMEACYLQEQAILSMYSYSAISGIVVDIGNHIDIFPVVEGCMIESGTTRLPYGGRQITDSFTRMLTEKGLRLFSEVESYVSQAIKEKVSFVAKFTSTDDEPPVDTAMVVDLEKYSLADGTRNVTVDTARYRCTEGLFKPSVWGKDNPGIHELTVKAIMASGIDMRKQMCRNVYLSGGGSMSAGLAERLQAEVSALMPSTTHVQVHAGLERQHASYIGASVVAKLPLFEELCVSKEDWDELGPYALEKWSTL